MDKTIDDKIQDILLEKKSNLSSIYLGIQIKCNVGKKETMLVLYAIYFTSGRAAIKILKVLEINGCAIRRKRNKQFLLNLRNLSFILSFLIG